MNGDRAKETDGAGHSSDSNAEFVEPFMGFISILLTYMLSCVIKIFFPK